MSAKRTLHEGWTVTGDPGAPVAVEAIPASVPGEVVSDLLAAGLVGDPYVDEAERELAWVGRRDWTYRTAFTHDAGDWDGIELAFDGLDTVARVSLNGTVVGETANMHRRYRFDVREVIREGANELEVHFTAPYAYAEAQRDRLGDRPNAYPEPGNFIRKAACNFGWDWGPNLAGAGIWRPVRLECWKTARIDAVVPRVSLEDGSGIVELDVRLQRAAGADIDLACTVARQDGAVVAETAVRVAAGAGSATVRLEVENPELWRPLGHGDLELYDAKVTVRSAGTVLDEWERPIGFRAVELDTEPDADGRPYRLEVNGETVWIKGVNWIPDEALFGRIDPARIERRLRQAVEAGVNYIRVWGGGVYESEDFYRICDRLGLLVGQDFLFACAAYPEEEPFWSEVEAEARDNLARLAPHPSLVTWTGNNENLWGWHDWDWQGDLGDRTWGAGYYHDLLPKLVSEVDGTRPYWPGSPYSGTRELHPNEQAHASVHIWDVWNKRDYVHYRDWKPRFVAEFGYQAPPTWATVRRMVHDDPLTADSPAMLWHQKAEGGQDKLQAGLDAHLPPVRDFDDWLYFTQVNQARAMRLGIEYFRSLQPYCSGAIVWQLNDCWPVTSWAAIDGEERLKPLWYALRDVFADRLVTFQPDGDGLNMVVVNDSAEVWEGVIGFWKCNAEGRIIGRALVQMEIDPRDTAVLELEPGAVPRDGEFLLTGREEFPRATWFTKEDKDMDWPKARFATEVAPVEGGVSVTVHAESVLRDLCLFADRLDPDAVVDKALITLVPGEHVVFTVRSEKIAASPELQRALTGKPVLRAIND
ncbi:glycoside hydrolase family 2 protein [Glycomyces tritici]|uniref:beta-mannosidase n=1 Tax=Glycomyces tritici TaxID=2665176 RepID=A0ABT7YN56_9ACTN|nr:glycoside hydrolase family 2 TIM barrel-domain containing protein [Glycomyces tritici]MDN3239839.1 glycoside hydrolase family 2 TIM barrel-domain containing protein [Glycomyces tritici]